MTHCRNPRIKLLSTTLSAALIISGLGPNVSHAVAMVLKAAPVKVPVQGTNIGRVGSANLSPLPLTTNLNVTLGQSLPSLALPAPAIYNTAAQVGLPQTAAQQAAVAPNAARTLGAAPLQARPNIITPQDQRQAAKAPSLRERLSATVAAIGKNVAPSTRFGTLHSLFHGGRKNTAGAVFASDTTPTPDGSDFGGLEKPGVAKLEKLALDRGNNLDIRIKAVQTIGSQATELGDAAKESLDRIAGANPEGGANDYEVHRHALRELANGFDDLRSLRRISPEHASEVLAELRMRKPGLVISDYDDTLKDFKEPLDAEDGARIQKVSAAGVNFAILTDRPAVPKRESDVGVLDSVNALTPTQKKDITVISDKSLKSTTFDEEGTPTTREGEKLAWTTQEHSALEAARDTVLDQVETHLYGDPAVRSNLYDSGLVIFLKLEMPAAEVEDAANLLKDELAKRGVTEYNVVGRTPAKDPHKNPPYLSVTKVDKSVGVRRIVAEKGVDPKSVVIMGDQFMTQGAGRPTDEFMLEGAPGARGIAVGPTADPRLDGVILWNTEGASASQAILDAIGEQLDGIEAPSITSLEELALNRSQDLDARIEAVQAIGSQAAGLGDAVKESLDRIAAANPEGGAIDYEVHRHALRQLATQFDDLRSLRRVSPKHAEEILTELRAHKPGLVISDYDDTLKDFKEPLDAEDGARIEKVSAAGVNFAILTDRPAVPKRESDVGVLDSVNALTPAQKKDITVISDKSLKSTTFDEEGTPTTQEGEKLAWTTEEHSALEAARDTVLEQVETHLYGDPAVRSNLYDSGLVIFLKLEMPATEVEDAANLLKGELAKRGVTEYNVVGRTPAKDPHKNPPYLSVTKVDKSVGVRRIVAEKSIDPKSVLIMGDQFMTQGAGRPTDEFMLEGAPGARGIAVGPTADPRLDNVILWNTKGASASQAVLDAIGQQVNTRGVFGLLSSSLISIAAFGFVLIAMPVMIDSQLGAGALANVFALGTAAATGLVYISGKMIDFFSLRQSTLANTWMRVIALALHPALFYLGLLNFWSLSALVMLDLWLLSSIVATNVALVPFLVGGDRTRNTTMGSVNWLIFAGTQVIVGLVISGGAIVDNIGWPIVYGIAALVNLAMIPLISKTIPDVYTSAGRKFRSFYHTVAASLRGLFAKRPAGEKGARKFSLRNLAWGGAVGVAFTLFAVFNNALPLAAVFAAWTLTTPGFKRIMGNKLLRRSVPFMLMSGMIVYPLRNVYLPLIAKGMLPAGADIGLLVGQLSGGLFLGMMMASVALLNLPGKWSRIVQVGFGAAFAAMMYFLVMPGSVPAVLGAMALYTTLVAFAKKIPNWGWLAANIIGLPLIWLTLPAWGAIGATLLILALVGMIHNNTPLILNGGFYGGGYSDAEVRPFMGQVSASMGALFNAALAFGYALAHTLAPNAEAFPGALSSIAMLFTAAGLLFLPALFLIPGLNPFKQKDTDSGK
jgi:3-deoxy-D-manno-octulosonate 8-phosphate phosphatase KdsC-like HAD superfamily phosphatase/predicted HAD superfamily phosphohydrolase YqeG